MSSAEIAAGGALSRLEGVWTVERSRFVSKLTVKHRTGAITYAACIALVRGQVEVGARGGLSFDLELDPDHLVIGLEQRDPRWRRYRLPESVLAPMRFESTWVGHDRVRGILAYGDRSHEIEFDLATAYRKNSVEISLSTEVDHRALGLAWIPTGHLKEQARFVVRTRLTPVDRPVAARTRRAPANNRYGFMIAS